mmetsp:Transcript_41436/g.105987  ORF Transcript_41436/g.105987 Transcript_41436/m.105987 type:complete len:229 (-) Transcript_41436:273-959(-)
MPPSMQLQAKRRLRWRRLRLLRRRRCCRVGVGRQALSHGGQGRVLDACEGSRRTTVMPLLWGHLLALMMRQRVLVGLQLSCRRQILWTAGRIFWHPGPAVLPDIRVRALNGTDVGPVWMPAKAHTTLRRCPVRSQAIKGGLYTSRFHRWCQHPRRVTAPESQGLPSRSILLTRNNQLADDLGVGTPGHQPLGQSTAQQPFTASLMDHLRCNVQCQVFSLGGHLAEYAN